MNQIWTTSGTTGESKRVVLSEENIWHGTEGFALGHKAVAEDVFLNVVPPTFSAYLLSRGWERRGAVVINEPFTPGGFLKAVERHRATFTVMVPSMVEAVLDDPGFDPGRLSSLRVLVHGGFPIERELLMRALDSRLPMACSYGLTECGPDVTTFDVDEERAARGTYRMMSVGRPHIFNEVRVENGTLRVRGPNVGRYENELLNLERFDDDGWFDTRDEAEIDAEGYVYITGRSGGGVCG